MPFECHPLQYFAAPFMSANIILHRPLHVTQFYTLPFEWYPIHGKWRRQSKLLISAVMHSIFKQLTVSSVIRPPGILQYSHNMNTACCVGLSIHLLHDPMASIYVTAKKGHSIHCKIWTFDTAVMISYCATDKFHLIQWTIYTIIYNIIQYNIII